MCRFFVLSCLKYHKRVSIQSFEMNQVRLDSTGCLQVFASLCKSLQLSAYLPHLHNWCLFGLLIILAASDSGLLVCSGGISELCLCEFKSFLGVCLIYWIPSRLKSSQVHIAWCILVQFDAQVLELYCEFGSAHTAMSTPASWSPYSLKPQSRTKQVTNSVVLQPGLYSSCARALGQGDLVRCTSPPLSRRLVGVPIAHVVGLVVEFFSHS